MFTGIVTDVGEVVKADTSSEGSLLQIRSRLAADLEVGHSVSINGTCLTVVGKDTGSFDVEATPETLRRTDLGQCRAGSRVNLELAARLADFLGGHLVQGHVDEMGRVVSIIEEGNSWVFRFSASREFLSFCVMKGSVTVNGVSLTVSGIGEGYFEVTIIPHTHEVTNFSSLKVGDGVNLEADLISKYVESHVRHFKGLVVLVLALALSLVQGLAGDLSLQANSILIYANQNAKKTHRFVVRIARPVPDLVFEWESVNDQGTVHVYQRALEQSRRFTLLSLFEVGVDEEAPDETTLRLSRALFTELAAQKSLKLQLNGVPLKMEWVGEEPFVLKLDREEVEVTGVRVQDNRRGSWLFLKDPDLPLVLEYVTSYFHHRLESLSTPDRPSLRWIRRLPPIK